MVNLVIVEKHEVVRGALAKFFDAQPDIIVTGATTDLVGALELLERSKNRHVLLLSAYSAAMEGFEHKRFLLVGHPHIPVVVLTPYDSDGFLQAAQSLGVCGVVSKDHEISALLEMVRRVSKDK